MQEGRPNLNSAPDDPALFISQSGARMSRQSIWQVLRQMGKAAQLPVTLTPRLVRHTAALNMVRAGRPLPEIQALLGHSNALSTQALLQRLDAGK
jgi:integrase/recombinase XerD